jgi:hypothetical protein
VPHIQSAVLEFQNSRTLRILTAIAPTHVVPGQGPTLPPNVENPKPAARPFVLSQHTAYLKRNQKDS